MLDRIINFSIRQRFLVLGIVFALVLIGIYSMKRISVDAIPDLTDTQVIVFSKWNQSPDIIEDQVTYPIITRLLGVPKLKTIRGLSDYGRSYVYAIFEDGTDLYWARSRVLEYLSTITPQLPEGVEIELGPDATGVGWVYQYALVDKTGNYSLGDLRAYQDWFLKFQIQSVPGVSEVASFGGFEKQYQIQVNPNALISYGVGLQDVLKAVEGGNQERGARVIELSGIEYMIRVRGYAKNIEDIENIVVKTSKGVPVYVKNLARVVLAPEMRRGVADFNGEGDVVGGIVVMRHEENAAAVIERVKEKIESLKGSLPKGVELVATYDRSELIDKAIETLKKTLTHEMLVVALIILLFLLHFPSAIVPIITLPTAVILSFIPMYLFGVSANIMSLGGIAIAIGALVDAAIIVVENVRKKLEHIGHEVESKEKIALVGEAIREVAPASFYSLLVIAVSFVPIFALEAQEGKLFKPLAYTKNLSMLIAALLAVTLTPALIIALNQIKPLKKGSSFLKKTYNRVFIGNIRGENEHPISRVLFKIYGPAVDFVVTWRKSVIVVATAMVLATLPVFFKLGSEFMPPLNEGTILYMPTTVPGISVGEAAALLQKQDSILKSFPEVVSVHGKAGRAETATDPAPFSMMETVVVLKDPSEWRTKDRWYSFLPDFMEAPFQWIWPAQLSWEELIREMNTKMQFPGLVNAWTLPIKGRIDMLTTGMRTPVGIKILGNDLKVIEQLGQQLEATLPKVKGTRGVFSERVAGGFFLDFEFNREALARYGFTIKQAQEVLTAALGGKVVSTAIDGRERYGIQVRYARDFRNSIPDLNHILLQTPKGAQVPVGDIARIQMRTGPGMIRNENGLLAGYVFIDLDEVDIGTYVENAKETVAENIELPPGITLEWSGQYASIVRVKEKLGVVVPITLLIIFILILMNTGSLIKTGIVFLAIPFSAIGAVWFLYMLDYNMSIAVWVGLIALLGIDAEMGIFMLLYLDLAYERFKKEGRMTSFKNLREAIHEGAVARVRPKVMTVATTFMALLPIMWAGSSMIGADVMKRMAAPMVGGIFSSFLMELLVYPAIFAIWKARDLRKIG